jgi:hypothetical protein
MDITIEDLFQRFLFHANNVYRGATPENSSPLYEQLAAKIAHEPALLRLLLGLDATQQFANLFLGAVHYLLLKGLDHPLRRFYPSLVEIARSPQEAYPDFYAFCMENREKIRQVVTTHSVQTNEVTRCASLLPAFLLVASREPHQPLAMIELGASAGLNLLWDTYYYDYAEHGKVGMPSARVHIRCKSQGARALLLPQHMPRISHRVGIDLAPIDVADTQATHWLRALIWPEHHQRAELFEAALAAAQQSPPMLIAGDLVEKLPQALRAIPNDSTLCVFHSYTLNHCPPGTQEKLNDILTATGKYQTVYRLSLEYHTTKEHPRLMLHTYAPNGYSQEHLAFCESYGRWIEWL